MRLEGRGLSCAYGPTDALQDVNLVVGEGVLAVFGPNGAGKSTLLRLLAGERRPDRGSVLLDGVPVSAHDAGWRRRIGLVGHRSGLYGKLTVSENLKFFASLDGAAESGRVAAALAAVGASALASRRAEALSRGERQRAALARALVHDPEVLFLDEPFTGLDAAAASALEEVLSERGRRGRIIVLVTHDVVRGKALANRVAVLSRGRKVLDCEAAAAGVRRIVDLMGAPRPQSPGSLGEAGRRSAGAADGSQSARP